MPRKSATQPRLIADKASTPEAESEPDLLAHLRRPLTKEDLDKVRHIEGFPIGADEDIIALSDPPYYTACPNPFLEDFIKAYGKPYNEAADTYHREPYTLDVEETRNNAFVNAHSYATKAPHQAIMTLLLHFTKPGDVVYDGFAGTGMTAVASQLCGVPDNEFKLKMEAIFGAAGLPAPEWGERFCITGDLSPSATYIAANLNLPFDETAFHQEVDHLHARLTEECDWMYLTRHTDGRVGRVHAMIWSDVFVCGGCGKEFVFWDAAVDVSSRQVLSKFKCPHCGALQRKDELDHAWTVKFDSALNTVVKQIKMVPVLTVYSVDGLRGRFEKRVDDDDLRRIQEIETQTIPHWFPSDRMPEGEESRRNDKYGLTHVHHFFTWRNLRCLAAAFAHARSLRAKFLLTSLMFKSSILCAPLLSNYFAEKAGEPRGGWVGKERSGTLYCPSIHSEVSVLDQILSRKTSVSITAASRILPLLQVSSATSSVLPANSVDYIFTDPPFGANRMYSELNFLWEAWLKVRTDNQHEAIQNKAQEKTLLDYQRILEQCFQDYYRVLKPGRWISVEFSNTKASVWNALQTALASSGFVVAGVRSLNKMQGSIAQYTTTTAVKQDLVISAYKPRAAFERRFLELAGTEQGAWEFVREHLSQQPRFLEKDGVVAVIVERQNYLLFDRMVAFHIQRGASVPLSAAEFYAGLRQRFPERDGMYFLPEQVAEYDTKRAQVAHVEQLSLFVSDEKSAVQWLRTQLEAEPQTYQDIQPKFLQELHQARHEKMPELRQLLEENFLKDDEDCWYVPDPAKAEDLEKLRERGLLREFATYVESKGRLKTFRTEAVRAGFKSAWGKRDYKTIIEVARRLPEDVLQEDPALLMYYDNAGMRSGG